MSSELRIRPASEDDFDEIWRIFQSVISKETFYLNRADTTREEAYQKWMDKSVKTFVAEKENQILGVYLIKPNHIDLGSHIANASYIVDEKSRGRGVGKALALHSIAEAKRQNYKAIQFNFVVSTNEAAVSLWKSVGFKIIGTIPQAFKHKDLGYVDAYVMFLAL